MLLVFADLALAALAQRPAGRDRQFMLWMTLRAGAPSGHITRSDLLETAAALGMGTTSTMRKVVGAGEGLFWKCGVERDLWLRQPAKLAVGLGVRSFRAAFWLPEQDLRSRLGRRRAALAISSIAALRRGLPISAGVMAAMTQVAPRTVREWRRLSGLPARANFALVAPLERSRLHDFYADEPGLRALLFEGSPWLVRQLPNSLPVLGTEGVRSHLRRANRRLRRLRAGATPCEISHAGTARIQRYHVGARRRGADPSSPGYALLADPANPEEPRLWEPWPPRPTS